MRSVKMLAILGLGLLVSLAQVGYSAPMGTAFTYQGRLIDANGPADGVYDFLFKLYNEPNGTSPYIPLSNDINNIDVIDGYFTVELDFGSSVFNGNARWLEVSVRLGDCNDVNDYVTLSPRQEVTPTPYALHTRGIFVDSEENVGIGTTNPIGKLHVNGGKAADNTNGGDVVIKAQDGGDGHGFPGNGGVGGCIILIPGEGGVPDGFGSRGRDGKVGIGTSEPSEKLDVEGNIDVSGNRVKRYNGFPRPDYDSGWVDMSLFLTLPHNMGGDPSNYVVDLQFKDTSPTGAGVHQAGYGGDISTSGSYGAFWSNLTDTEIKIVRKVDSTVVDYIRVRIWVYD
jgi:hypothetical protein